METIRQSIMSNMDVKSLLDQSSEKSSRIKTAQKAVLVAEAELRNFKSNGINSIREGIEGIKGGHSFTVLMSVDDKNKPLYSNDAKRTSALNELLDNDPHYLQAKKSLKDAETKQFGLEQTVAYAKIEVEAKRNDFAIWKSQMELSASLSREEQTLKHTI